MIKEAVVEKYFQCFNAKDFRATADLFVGEGFLEPPFQPKIVGKDAIANYLQSEAQDITLLPTHYSTCISELGTFKHIVTGKVQVSLLHVNVAWEFTLSSDPKTLDSKIEGVRVKLLALLQELASFKNL
jgi:hypothetical protein